jgi:nicotinate-nucleotide adenylyltransferase
MIGVLGGTFDPVHLGHVRPALELLQALSLREIRFVIARIPPHRDPPKASAEHRWRMLELALQAHPGLIADDRELLRDGPSYTVDTLRGLRPEQDETLCLIMGSDAFVGFTAWRCWQGILRLANIVVITRPETHLPARGVIGELLQQRRVSKADDLARCASGGILPWTVRPVDVSATAIRSGLAAGRDVSSMLPAPVLRYIRSHGLYSATHSHAKLSKVDNGD